MNVIYAANVHLSGVSGFVSEKIINVLAVLNALNLAILTYYGSWLVHLRFCSRARGQSISHNYFFTR